MSEQSQQDLQRAEEAPQLFGAAGTEIYGPCPQCGYRHPDGANLLLLQSLGAEEALQKLTDGPACMRGPAQRGRSPAGMDVITELLDQMVHLLPAGEPITPS